MTAVEEGELLTRITIPPLPADAGAGYSTVAVGADSKAIARAAALVRGNGTIDERARGARLRLASAHAPHRNGGGAPGRRGHRGRGARSGRERSATTSSRSATSTAAPSTGARWRAWWRGARCARRSRREAPRMVDAGTVQAIEFTINGERVQGDGRVAAAARPLPPRHAGAEGHPRRLRHRQLRRLLGDRQRQADQELHDARAAGRRRRDRDGRGARAGRRADAGAAGLPRAARPPVRLLHARAGDGGDVPAAPQPEPERRGDPPRGPRQHLPLHRLREHHPIDRDARPRAGRARRRQHEHDARTETAVETRERRLGQSVPRVEDRRLLQGQGEFVDDVWMHRTGYAHFVRSPYGHARIVSIDVSRALSLDGVYAVAHRRRGQGDVRGPVLPDRARARRRKLEEWPLAVDKVRYHGDAVAVVLAETRELARDAAGLVEVEYEPLPAVVDTVKAADPDAPILHETVGTNVAWQGDVRLGRHRLGARERRPRRRDRPAALPSLLLDAARVQRRGRALGAGHRHGAHQLQQPDADVRLDGDRPDARRRLATA